MQPQPNEGFKLSSKTWLETHRANLIDLGQKLAVYDRVAIGGGPMTGKSLVSEQLINHYQVKSDTFMEYPWAEQPTVVLSYFNSMSLFPKWCFSGVQVGRCLRKGLVCDAVVYLEYPLSPLSFGQAKMAEGCKTVFNDWYFNYRDMKTPVFFL